MRGEGQTLDWNADTLNKMDFNNLSEAFPDHELEAMKLAFECRDLAEATEHARKSLEDLDSIQLNIAVTGASGSGKSTFINVMRGVEDEEEGAAQTGVVETTLEVTPYHHPRHRNVVYWDLPGIGTPRFRPNEYLESVKFNRFDFFFIIASERFRDCHAHLAQAIQSKGKKFYFIRSKIDADLHAFSKVRRSSYDEEKILGDIRDNCVQSLQNGGIEAPKVFLLSCLEPEKYDFYLMQRTLESELPSHKRHAFLMSLPNVFFKALDRKMEALKGQIWKHALISVGKTVLPTGGLDGDINYLVKTLQEYKEALGLDHRSLNQLANVFGKDVYELRSVMRSPLVVEEITPDLVCTLMHRKELTAAALMITEFAAKKVSGIKYLALGGVAFGSAYWLLYSFVNEALEDAGSILSKALQNTD